MRHNATGASCCVFFAFVLWFIGLFVFLSVCLSVWRLVVGLSVSLSLSLSISLSLSLLLSFYYFHHIMFSHRGWTSRSTFSLDTSANDGTGVAGRWPLIVFPLALRLIMRVFECKIRFLCFVFEGARLWGGGRCGPFLSGSLGLLFSPIYPHSQKFIPNKLCFKGFGTWVLRCALWGFFVIGILLGITVSSVATFLLAEFSLFWPWANLSANLFVCLILSLCASRCFNPFFSRLLRSSIHA